MNQVTTAQNTSPATSSGNAFEAYGNATTQKSIVGTLLKFNKGDWLSGQDNDEVEAGTRLVANMEELMVGWIRWEDNKPTDQIMGRVAEGYQPPKRHELGDNDKDQWETDDRGQPRDPWQFSNYLILKAEKGDELFTFAASSRGSINAVGELCKVYGKAMRQRPDEFPIIKLDGGSYNHPNKAYGRIKFPILEVVGWAPKAEFAEALAAEDESDDAGSPEPDAAAPTKAGRSPKAPAAETRF